MINVGVVFWFGKGDDSILPKVGHVSAISVPAPMPGAPQRPELNMVGILWIIGSKGQTAQNWRKDEQKSLKIDLKDSRIIKSI